MLCLSTNQFDFPISMSDFCEISPGRFIFLIGGFHKTPKLFSFWDLMTTLPISSTNNQFTRGSQSEWRNVILLSVGFGLCFFGTSLI